MTIVLRTIANMIPENKSWAVDGSCSLALQGIDLMPHDIDILTDAESAYEIGNILSDYCVQEVEFGETEKYRSHFGKFLVNSVRVEIMGDLQEYRKGVWSSVQNPEVVELVNVMIDGLRIPAVSISHFRSTGYLDERLDREKRSGSNIQ